MKTATRKTLMRNLGWIVALFLASIVLVFWRQDLQLRKEAKDLRAENAAEKAALERTEDREKLLLRENMANSDARNAISSPNGKTSERNQSVSLAALLKDHPEFTDVWRKILRRQVIGQNLGLFTRLNLAADKMEKLKEMMVEGRLSVMDATDAALQMGIGQNSPEMQALRNQTKKRNDDEIEAMLGPDDAVAWRQAALVQRWQSNQEVQDVQSDTIDAGIPLTPDQIWNLEEVFQEQSLKKVDDPNQIDPRNGLTPGDLSRLEAAAKFLSPQQVQILRDGYILSHRQADTLKTVKTGVSW